MTEHFGTTSAFVPPPQELARRWRPHMVVRNVAERHIDRRRVLTFAMVKATPR